MHQAAMVQKDFNMFKAHEGNQFQDPLRFSPSWTGTYVSAKPNGPLLTNGPLGLQHRSPKSLSKKPNVAINLSHFS